MASEEEKGVKEEEEKAPRQRAWKQRGAMSTSKDVEEYYQKLRLKVEEQMQAELESGKGVLSLTLSGSNAPTNESPTKPKRRSFLFKKSQQDSKTKVEESVEVSAPSDVRHSGHIGFNEEGQMEDHSGGDQLPQVSLDWSDLVDRASYVQMPTTVKEAKESLRIKAKRTRPASAEITQKNLNEAKYNRMKKRCKKLLRIRAELEEKLRESEGRNVELEAKLGASVGAGKLEEECAALKEKVEACEQTISKLEEAKLQLDLEVTDLKVKLAEALKKESSETMYAKRKLQQTIDKAQEELKDQQKANGDLQQANKALLAEVDSLKEQVKTAMSLDVKQVQAQHERQVGEMKAEAEQALKELQRSYEQEKTERVQLQGEKERLEAENSDLKSKVEAYKQAEVDVVEMKKSYFKEMQHQKGQMMAELKKMKEKWESMKEAHSRISASYQHLLNEKRERTSGSMIAPPPPPTDAPKRQEAQTREKPKEEELEIRLTPVHQESVANVLAYAILARRVNLDESTTLRDEDASSDSDWDD